VLRSAALVHANVAAAAMFGGYAAFQFVVTLYVQTRSAGHRMGMALAFLPAGLLVALSATKMDAVLSRFNTRVLILFGLLALVLATAGSCAPGPRVVRQLHVAHHAATRRPASH